MALAPQLLAEIGGATVLPDNRVVDRLTGFAIPHNSSLALIRDADRGQIGGTRSESAQSLERDRDLGGRYLLGIVFDPTRLRKNLVELPLRDRSDRALAVKQ